MSSGKGRRWSTHDLKVAGSDPAPATTESDIPRLVVSVSFLLRAPVVRATFVSSLPRSIASIRSRAGPEVSTIRSTSSRILQDPTQSSWIILTTVTDVTGFFSFLGIATLLSTMI